MIDDPQLLWRLETVARQLDVSVRTLRRWRDAGKFPDPDLRMGNKLLWWKPETVQAWLAAQRQAAG